MYSSGDATTVGTRYDPLQYGLKAIRYRVRHFGHSTQWRRKEDIDPVRQDRSSNRTKLDVWGTLLPVVIAHGSWCRENEGRGISSTLNRGSYWLISRVLPAWRRHLSRWSLRCYGSNSEAKPSRRSICRRTFWGRLPCGLGRTAEDTAVPGGTGVAMKPGDSNVSGWNASPTI